MNAKLITVLLIIVLLPIGVLSWMGYRLAVREEAAIEQQFSRVMESKLANIDGQMKKVIQQRERHFDRLLTQYINPALRREEYTHAIRKSPQIRQIFVLNARGDLTYPLKNSHWNQHEHEFFRRTEGLWQDSLLFDHIKRAEVDENGEGTPTDLSKEKPLSEVQKKSQKSRRGKQSKALHVISHAQYKGRQAEKQLEQKNVSNVILSGKHQGWYTWYSGSGVNLIFWKHLSDGRIIGVEMSMSRMLSDLIAALPDTDPLDGKESEGRIVLLNSSQTPLYQWGNYQPKKGAKPRVTRPISFPLNAWYLEIYNDTSSLTAGIKKSFMFNLVAGGLSVGLVIVLLAIYLFRESTRQARDATTKVNFVNSVSHELKTPLTNIRMYAELLEKRLAGEDAKCDKYVGVITAESQRLSRLISNVLTYSKGQRHQLKVRKSQGNVDDCLRGLADQFQPGFSRKGIRISFNPGIANDTLFDSDILEQIMVNLFSNVEKYAHEGEFMGISSSQTEDKLSIKVCDKGKGIPIPDQARIFMPFQRLDDKLTEGVSGTGIGLSIARELARKHGGDLTVEPTEYGSGTCFHLTL